MSCDAYGRLDIEEAVGVRDADGDFPAADKLLGPFHGFGGQPVQDLQRPGGLPADGAEGRGDGEANHAGARDADAHPVLEDVGADGDIDVEVGAEPPGPSAHFRTVLMNNFRSLGNGQSHGYRLGAAEGRLHLAVDKGDDIFFAHIRKDTI